VPVLLCSDEGGGGGGSVFRRRVWGYGVTVVSSRRLQGKSYLLSWSGTMAGEMYCESAWTCSSRSSSIGKYVVLLPAE
jgi:hypothetical protein